MHSVQRVGAIIERAYGADALTVACQASSHLLLISDVFLMIVMLLGWQGCWTKCTARTLPFAS